MKRLILVLLLALPLFAASVRNDDSCDIGVYPAATLLLPYFQVDIGVVPEGSSETTIFTVTNTSPQPQAARVTLWTDFAYPVFSFDLFLTGYDVQKINLFDVIKNGRIAPDTELGSNASHRGELSDEDNPRLDEISCRSLPGVLPSVLITRMQSAFTTGRVPDIGEVAGCRTAGGAHVDAIGYATIDVVGACTGRLPTETNYFTHEIRFDNVLTGDYVQINTEQNFAQGNPMVHIRAVPEGGQAATRRRTNLPRTFYSRLQSSNATRTLDGRQPLPSTFAARWIEGGRGGFETYFKIWRESNAASDAACSSYPTSSYLPVAEISRFDENENVEGIAGVIPGPAPSPQILPSSSMITTLSDPFPVNTAGAVAGWMYFNLHTVGEERAALQNWVTTSMRAETRFSVDLDAVALGNGCTPATAQSNAVDDPRPNAPPIGPAPNVNP